MFLVSDAAISSARGNTSLESAVSLTKSLRWEIQSLGQRLGAAANAEELIQRKSSRAKDDHHFQSELKQIISAIRKLLSRIEDAVPLINLAITASGASLSSTLPSTVSPSRLLQSSTFLTAGDAQYAAMPLRPVQIGPTFTLSMYMLFIGHVRPQTEADVRASTWKEVIHKANVKLMRVPVNAIYHLPGTHTNAASGNGHTPGASNPGATDDEYCPSQIEGEGKADEYAYQLTIIEDLEDDRVHSFDDDEAQPGPCDDVELAGIRETVPIHELSKIFYADTGKILNIGTEGETNSPVLLLKRDVNAAPPRRMMDRYTEGEAPDDGIVNASPSLPNGHDEGSSQLSIVSQNDGPSQLSHTQDNRSTTPTSPPPQNNALIPAPNPWRLPPNLDPEWLAFEVYTETPDSDTEASPPSTPTRRPLSRTPSLSTQATHALSRLNLSAPPPSSPNRPHSPSTHIHPAPQPTLPPLKTSLSLLETLLRLLSLQQFQQAPHLSIPDELLTFFLSESASTGADGEERKRLRTEARRRVGFDPYDESPVKRRGEEYQYQHQDPDESRSEYAVDAGYETYSSTDSPKGGSGGPGGERYASPLRYDEGYETHAWERPSPVLRAGSSPLLLKGRAQSERGGTPLRWQRGGAREGEMRRGSPLARGGTGAKDEGLGTSPGVGGEEGGKGGRGEEG